MRPRRPRPCPLPPAVEAPPVELPVADAPAARLRRPWRPRSWPRSRPCGLPAIRLLPQPGQALPEAPVSSLGGRPQPARGDGLARRGRPPDCCSWRRSNYAEMPVLEGYPTEGLLSVFLADDATQGCAFPSLDQAGFRSFHFADAGACVRRDAPGAPQGGRCAVVPLARCGRGAAGRGGGRICRGLRCARRRRCKSGWPRQRSPMIRPCWRARLAAGKGGRLQLWRAIRFFAQGDVRQGPLRFHAKVLLQLGRLGRGRSVAGLWRRRRGEPADQAQGSGAAALRQGTLSLRQLLRRARGQGFGASFGGVSAPWAQV